MGVPSSFSGSFDHHLIPERDFNINPDISGELGSKLSGGIDAKHSGSLETKVSGLLTTDSVLKLKGDAKEPVATDSKIEILNLPRFTLQDIKDMQKVRVRIPNYSNICFKAFGIEMFNICLSGESQVITEPYIPTAAERCETDCCEPDTRPFPEPKEKTHG
ncbi:hypothetical protein [Ferruginibacter sp. SUN106]|uniref:hypothetical protein n=1 Tax=Ferruginibacter sp. SUN106 TaxID=2978348 RepID=UPI003D35FD8A